MSSYYSIEFDFEQAKNQAKIIDEIASDLNTLTNSKFDSTMQTLSSNWKGESANAYMKKGVTLQSYMKTSARDLNTVANNIRIVARRIYEAEMEAKRIAEAAERARHSEK
jgi:WXG100 family type VII secretion target